jgi:hypothetical protein
MVQRSECVGCLGARIFLRNKLTLQVLLA